MKYSVHIRTVWWMVLAILFLPSCIHDSLEDCFSECRLFLDYIPANYSEAREGIREENLTRLNLFVFDEEGIFVREYTDESPELSPEYYIALPGLPSGYYQIMAWGGLNTNYVISEELVPRETHISELELYLKHTERASVTTTIPHLFYASKEDELIEVIQGQDVKDKLKLVQDTYVIHVTVNGLETTNETYTISIEDNIGTLTFDNSITSTEKYNYITTCQNFTGSLTVLRLMEERKGSVPFRLESNQKDKPLFEEDIIELLLAIQTVGGKVNFSYMHEFDIILTAQEPADEAAEVTFTVSVNGWNLTSEDTPL
ncbi:MAG: FimB/Mfa2 family fimbrial subunit [Tannerellaceae bacterium]|nr:FimB/Mfa2 family fimbrial subunit [Tannerellaceae bacterium]